MQIVKYLFFFLWKKEKEKPDSNGHEYEFYLSLDSGFLFTDKYKSQIKIPHISNIRFANTTIYLNYKDATNKKIPYLLT